MFSDQGVLWENLILKANKSYDKDCDRKNISEAMINLHEMRRVQRGPETQRNLKQFATNFEAASLNDPKQSRNTLSLTQRMSSSNKYHRASSLSIDSWSLDSTMTESSEIPTPNRHPMKKRSWSSWLLIALLSSFFITAFVMGTMYGFLVSKDNTNEGYSYMGM